MTKEKISLVSTKKCFLNGMKITTIEYHIYDAGCKCWLLSKTWVNGWYVRECIILNKLKEQLVQRQQMGVL